MTLRISQWRSLRSLIGKVFLAAVLLGVQGNHGPATAEPIAGIQDYLNGFTSLTANFLQVAPDGSISEGALYLARPGGRIRLEYSPPSSLLLVGSDGWVTVLDRAAEEDSRWPVRGTPFEALLGDHIDFSSDVSVRNVDTGGGVTRVTVEGRDEPEAGSLTLVFSDAPLELRQWQVIDSQRLITTVTLSDVRLNTAIDSELFIHKDPELWSDE